MNNAKKILENTKTTKTLLGKSTMTSGNKYQVKINYNGKNCYMVYNDNFYNNSTKEDFLYCLMSDALAYTNCYNFADFMAEFGYSREAEAKKAYNGCKRQYIKYNKLFNNAEQKELENYFSNY